MKDQVYSQRVNMLGELKAQVTAAIADVTKDMLQCIWQKLNYWWRDTHGAHCEEFRRQQLLHMCVKRTISTDG
jgi:hypothetical protein